MQDLWAYTSNVAAGGNDNSAHQLSSQQEQEAQLPQRQRAMRM